MACSVGPKVANDGLVFYMDSSNTRRSWRGKPTVNLIGSNFFDGNGNFTIDENINHFMPDGSVGIARLLNAQFVSDPNRTVSIGSYSLQAGQTYTLSFYAMNIDCSGFSGNLYSPTLLRVIGSIVYPTLSLDTWTRVSTTFTVPNEGPNPVVLSPQAFRDGGNGRFKLCWLQLEEGSFATPYVTGTRDSTQAFFDLSGRNTVTASSINYYSNNSFDFDGSSSGIATSATASSLGISNDLTISIVTRRAASPTNALQGQAGFGSGGSISIKNSSNYFADVISTNSTRYIVHISPAGGSMTPYENVWVNLCVTVSGTSIVTYLNGVLASSQTMDSNIKTFSSEVFGVGNGYGYFRLKGDVAIAQVYNRALSAQEIYQNFESIRGRYGI